MSPTNQIADLPIHFSCILLSQSIGRRTLLCGARKRWLPTNLAHSPPRQISTLAATERRSAIECFNAKELAVLKNCVWALVVAVGCMVFNASTSYAACITIKIFGKEVIEVCI